MLGLIIGVGVGVWRGRGQAGGCRVRTYGKGRLGGKGDRGEGLVRGAGSQG